MVLAAAFLASKDRGIMKRRNREGKPPLSDSGAVLVRLQAIVRGRNLPRRAKSRAA
jgi:hypothetical protein